jgi:hypothetical protein
MPDRPFAEFEISPDPTPGERAALERALAAARLDVQAGQRAWWEHGLREALLGDGDDAAAPAPQRASSKLWRTIQGAKPRRR